MAGEMAPSVLGENSALLFAKKPVSGPLLAATDAVDLQSEALVCEKPEYEAEGAWGGREPDSATVTAVGPTRLDPKGSFAYKPRYGDKLAEFFELALGSGTGAALTPFVPASDGITSALSIQAQRAGLADLAENFLDAKINSFEWLSEGQNGVKLTANVLAQSAEKVIAEGGDGPALLTPDYSLIAGVVPVLHQDLVLTGDVAGFSPRRLLLKGNNNLSEDGYGGSKTRQWMTPGKFLAELELDVNLNAASAAIVRSWYDSKAVKSVVATYTSSAGNGAGIVFTVKGTLTSPPPNIDGPGEKNVTLTFSGKAIYTAGALTSNQLAVVIVAPT